MCSVGRRDVAGARLPDVVGVCRPAQPLPCLVAQHGRRRACIVTSEPSTKISDSDSYYGSVRDVNWALIRGRWTHADRETVQRDREGFCILRAREARRDYVVGSSAGECIKAGVKLQESRGKAVMPLCLASLRSEKNALSLPPLQQRCPHSLNRLYGYIIYDSLAYDLS
jgi:hypothetical protein